MTTKRSFVLARTPVSLRNKGNSGVFVAALSFSRKGVVSLAFATQSRENAAERLMPSAIAPLSV
jgi:hypothetical protein